MDTDRIAISISRVSSRMLTRDKNVNTAQDLTFEHVAVFLDGSGLKLLFVVICRPGSVAASSSFFEEFADLLYCVHQSSSGRSDRRRSKQLLVAVDGSQSRHGPAGADADAHCRAPACWTSSLSGSTRRWCLSMCRRLPCRTTA